MKELLHAQITAAIHAIEQGETEAAKKMLEDALEIYGSNDSDKALVFKEDCNIEHLLHARAELKAATEVFREAQTEFFIEEDAYLKTPGVPAKALYGNTLVQIKEDWWDLCSGQRLDIADDVVVIEKVPGGPKE